MHEPRPPDFREPNQLKGKCSGQNRAFSQGAPENYEWPGKEPRRL